MALRRDALKSLLAALVAVPAAVLGRRKPAPVLYGGQNAVFSGDVGEYAGITIRGSADPVLDPFKFKEWGTHPGEVNGYGEDELVPYPTTIRLDQRRGNRFVGTSSGHVAEGDPFRRVTIIKGAAVGTTTDFIDRRLVMTREKIPGVRMHQITSVDVDDAETIELLESDGWRKD